jgi:hypothetical protein
MKTVTSISIDSNVLERAKAISKGNLSELIENSLKEAIGYNITKELCYEKLQKAYDESNIWQDKLNELIVIEEQEVKMKTEVQQQQLAREKEDRQIIFNRNYELVKDIPEFIQLNEDIKNNPDKIKDVKFLLAFLEILRKNHPEIKLGVTQIREVLMFLK